MDTAVALVESYLEFCGYFVLSEVPVRKRVGKEVVDITDLDILAVHFPHAGHPNGPASSLDLFLSGDPVLETPDDVVDVVIGEVKEGKARLNDALDREEAVAFGLRRIGRGSQEHPPEETKQIARGGHPVIRLANGLVCRPRYVVFAGRGEVGEPGVRTIPLAHCVRWIRRHLRDDSGLLAGAHFKQDVLRTLALLEKVD